MMEMPGRTSRFVLLLPLVLGLILFLTSTSHLIAEFWNYDTKRILEMVLFPLLFSFALFYPPLRVAFTQQIQQISVRNRWLTLFIFSVGLVSSVYHAESLRHFFYSALDVVLFGFLVTGVLILAAVRTLTGVVFDRLSMIVVLMIGLGVGVEELAGVAAAGSAGLEFNFRVSLLNFSWPRFFNQVQSWTIPVLAALPALFWKKPLALILCVCVIGLNWYILLMTGARGTVVGLVSAMMLILVLFPTVRREAITWHISGLILGVGIYLAILLSMTSDPQLNASDGVTVAENKSSEQLVTEDHLEIQNSSQSSSFYDQSLGRKMWNTSGRWSMWQVSLADIRGHPFLGIGPMNFACKGPLNEAGHPHSFPLQVAGEWGIPAALALMLLLASLALAAFKKLRKNNFNSRTEFLLAVLLAGGILTASVHACLSGVFVMPASQLAGMLICGWFLGILSASPADNQRVEKQPVAGKVSSALILTLVLAASLPTLFFCMHELANREETMNQTRIGDQLIPRFWQNGKMCGI